jgi:hypothetical protein
VVRLAPLLLSVRRHDFSPEANTAGTKGMFCQFCGETVGKVPDVFASKEPCCVLCGLVQNLGRPRVDEEAQLIWLPELSQPALNALGRRVHINLRRHGEGLETGAQPSTAAGDLPTLYQAGQALLARKGEAETRLGTSNPSDLADALLRLSPAGFKRRDTLLGGVRLLAMGKLFDAEGDVYPQIVDSWQRAEAESAPAKHGGSR